jgi:hypothetical protein
VPEHKFQRENLAASHYHGGEAERRCNGHPPVTLGPVRGSYLRGWQ